VVFTAAEVLYSRPCVLIHIHLLYAHKLKVICFIGEIFIVFNMDSNIVSDRTKRRRLNESVKAFFEKNSSSSSDVNSNESCNLSVEMPASLANENPALAGSSQITNNCNLTMPKLNFQQNQCTFTCSETTESLKPHCSVDLQSVDQTSINSCKVFDDDFFFLL